MVTTQTADAVLKSYYLGVVSDQLDKSANPLLAAIKKTTADVWGRDVRKAVRVGVNGGVGAGTESGDLPKAGGNRYAQFVSTLKNLYGTVEISDKAIRASSSNEGAFVDLLNDEMDGLVKSSSYNFGRMLFGDGSGVLATFSDATKVDDTRNLAEGMVVDLYAAGGTAKKEGVTVLSIDRSTKKVTLSEGTPAATDFLVMQNSYGLEITGLKAILEDTTPLYGVDRTTNAWLTPYKKTGVGTLTETALQTAIDGVEEYAGGKVNFIVCSWGVRRALVEKLSSFRSMEPMKLEGGFTALNFNGIPVVADRFCPAGTAYLLNTDDFALHQLGDWQWLEGEDGKILKQIPGKPVYTATLVKYAELMCYRPGGQAVLKGITEA